jgi:hypothetical protein
MATPPDFAGVVVNRAGFSPIDLAVGQLLLSVQGLRLDSLAGRQLNLCPRGRIGPTVMGTSTLWADCSTAGEVAGRTPSLTWLSGGAIYSITTREQSPAAQRFVEFFAAKLVKVDG